MSKWEYQFYAIPSTERATRQINELGTEGWEAVGMTPIGLLFKRRLFHEGGPVGKASHDLDVPASWEKVDSLLADRQRASLDHEVTKDRSVIPRKKPGLRCLLLGHRVGFRSPGDPDRWLSLACKRCGMYPLNIKGVPNGPGYRSAAERLMQQKEKGSYG